VNELEAVRRPHDLRRSTGGLHPSPPARGAPSSQGSSSPSRRSPNGGFIAGDLGPPIDHVPRIAREPRRREIDPGPCRRRARRRAVKARASGRPGRLPRHAPCTTLPRRRPPPYPPRGTVQSPRSPTGGFTAAVVPSDPGAQPAIVGRPIRGAPA
jgi:hypothetical protein